MVSPTVYSKGAVVVTEEGTLEAIRRTSFVPAVGGEDWQLISTTRIYSKSVQFTDEQIKKLPTTPVEIVPAAGVGKLLVPISTTYIFNAIAGYSGITDASWVLIRGNIYASTLTLVESLLSAPDGAGTYAKSGGGSYFEPGSGTFDGVVTTGGGFHTPSLPYDNLPLTLKDDWGGLSDYGDGNAANILTVKVSYIIVDL